MKKFDRKAVGDFIKKRRLEKGLTQMDLAEKIGVSYQQIQKYERGVSELSVNRLRQLAEAMDIQPHLFIEQDNFVSEPAAGYEVMTKDEQTLLKLYRKIKDKKLKKTVLEFLKRAAKLH